MPRAGMTDTAPDPVEGWLRRALDAPGSGTSDWELNPAPVQAAPRPPREAGVLIAVVRQAGRAEVILTKRSPLLKHHPGQIAFPGGKVEPEDEGPAAAALREAEEEIGLPRGLPQVLGTLPQHVTVTGFRITPVLALLEGPFEGRPEPGEVAEIFTVPLAHLADPANYRIDGRRWQGAMRRYVVVPWGPNYIWGATARMLKGLAVRMDRCR